MHCDTLAAMLKLFLKHLDRLPRCTSLFRCLKCSHCIGFAHGMSGQIDIQLTRFPCFFQDPIKSAHCQRATLATAKQIIRLTDLEILFIEIIFQNVGGHLRDLAHIALTGLFFDQFDMLFHTAILFVNIGRFQTEKIAATNTQTAPEHENRLVA